MKAWMWGLGIVAVVACGGGKDGDDGLTTSTTAGVSTAADTADSGRVRVPPNPFDATNVTFEFDGILTREGVLTGYWDSDSAHVMPGDWNPPTVTVEFADELLFDGETDSEEVMEAHTCSVTTELVSEVVDDLENENDARLSHAFEGYLKMYYFEQAGDFLTFTDCPDELDEDTWGPEGRDLWMAFDGARFGFGFGDVTRTDLREYWSDESWAEYENSMIASYIAVNQLNDDGDLVYMGDALASCLLFEYDAVTGELVDDDDDDVLELVDLSGVGEGDPMPESYVRCFAYWWPQLGSFDLSRLAEGANGSPSDTGT
jgi:hypothetical protein